MYSIGQVSKMYNLPISTLRYYDKEGLFPRIERRSGIRRFGEIEIETLKVIDCLKASGLEIKDIKQFMAWVEEGPATYEKRKELFEARKEAVKEEIARLEKMLCLIEYKCWYYETAIKDGNEERIAEMLPDKLPESIQTLFDKSHSAN